MMTTNHDPASHAYEAARGRLAARLFAIGKTEPRNGYTEMADLLLKGELYEMPTWVALQMLAEGFDRAERIP